MDAFTTDSLRKFIVITLLSTTSCKLGGCYMLQNKDILELKRRFKKEACTFTRMCGCYVDANKNIILQSIRIEQERLQNEMNLAYQVYANVAGQLQMAKSKVQEAKPVFAVVEPATVPLKPSGTSRKMILLGVVLFALVATTAWILFGNKLWINIKQGLEEKS